MFRLVRPASGERSTIWLFESPRMFRLVRPASGERSTIWLFVSTSTVRLVKSASGDRSVIWLFESPRFVRLVANSSPIKSLMPAAVSKVVKVSISLLVIVAPLALPSAAAIAARRLASGMVTGVGS